MGSRGTLCVGPTAGVCCVVCRCAVCACVVCKQGGRVVVSIRKRSYTRRCSPHDHSPPPRKRVVGRRPPGRQLPTPPLPGRGHGAEAPLNCDWGGNYLRENRGSIFPYLIYVLWSTAVLALAAELRQLVRSIIPLVPAVALYVS